MKVFQVIVTPNAEEDFKKYLSYLRDVKKNPQAVQSVIEDFRDTKNTLSNMAGSLAEPKSEQLRRRGLKRINFLRHNYFLLYYIGRDGIVYITNVFHDLEDYESRLR